MITLLLCAGSFIWQSDEPTPLAHRQRVEVAFTSAKDDDVRFRLFRFALTSPQSVLFVRAGSDAVELSLEDEKASPQGAAALLGNRSPSSSSNPSQHRSPFLRVAAAGFSEVQIRLIARSGAGSAWIEAFEARETPETLAAAAALKSKVSSAQQHLGTRRFAEAREILEQALQSALEVEAHPRSEAIADALFPLGALAFNAEGRTICRRAWETVFAFRSAALPDDHPQSLDVRGGLAVALSATGAHERARDLHREVLDICTDLYPADHRALQSTKMNLATDLSILGDVRGARRLLEEVLEVYERTLPMGHVEIQKVRLNLAANLKKLGLVREALDLEERAVGSYERTLPPHHPNLQRAKVNLAASLLELGRFEEARPIQEAVLLSFAETLPPDHVDLQRARLNLAVTLDELGESHASRALLEQALEVRSRSVPPDHRDLQLIKLNLAETLVQLGDLQAARALHEQVLEVRSRALPDDHIELQSSRRGLGSLYFELGDYETSKALFERSLEAFSSELIDSGHPDVQSARAMLAAIHQRRGELDDAIALIQKVLETWPKDIPESHATFISALSHLGATYRKMGRFEEAVATEERILETIRPTADDVRPRVRALRSNLSWSYAHVGRIEDARELARDQAASAIRSHRQFGAYSPRELEAHALDWQQEIDWALSIQLGLGIFEPDEAGLWQVFSASEAIRTAATTATRLSLALRGDPELETLRRELILVGNRINELSERHEAESRFVEAIQERDQLQRQLAEKIAGRDLNHRIPSVDPQTIRDRLRPAEAAVGFWRYRRMVLDPETRMQIAPKHHYLAWVLRPEKEPTWVELGEAAPIEAAVRDWQKLETTLGGRGVTGRRSKSGGNPAATLSTLILAPLLPELEGIRRLHVAPSHALHAVPLDALPIEGAPLGDRMQVIAIEGLSLLTLDSPTRRGSLDLFAMGGIDYDTTGPSSSKSAGALESPLRSSPRAAFPALEETSSEVESIKALLESTREADPKALLAIGADATQETFIENAPRSEVLHIATHGWFERRSSAETIGWRGDNPIATREERVRGLTPSLLCGLAFAGANAGVDAVGRRRGILTAEELRSLDLSSVDLAVLSACETNLGESRDGQGIASLQSALHAAGVKTAITSVWKVPDAATRELMTEFYRRLWVLEESTADALWNAKRLLRGKRDAEGQPVHGARDWAGWVLSQSSR
ncbi:MAG: tetratricopeptide repeat protein [Planctomycetota bacterium]